MEAVAMVCILALLFPVISLTDDLHPETVAVDAASGKRNACLIAASAPQVRSATASSGMHFAVGVISKPSAEFHFTVADFVPFANFNNPSYLASSFPGRSPPSLL